MKASKNMVLAIALSFLAGGATVLLADDDKHPEISRAIEELNAAAGHLHNADGHELKGHRKEAWNHVQTAIKEARAAHEE